MVNWLPGDRHKGELPLGFLWYGGRLRAQGGVEHALLGLSVEFRDPHHHSNVGADPEESPHEAG